MYLERAPFSNRQGRGVIAGACGNLEVAYFAAAESGELQHEGLLAVVCHPHPLHDGTMDNKVVTTLARVYRDLGIPVVTFNFRGVGASDGEHDNGVGEVEDLLAAVAWSRDCYPGRQLLLAGFSFGSAVAASASYRLSEQLRHLILVAPPVERYSYDRGGEFPCPLLVIIGDDDELVDVPRVVAWAEQIHSASRLLRYPQTSHFFHGKLSQLKRDLTDLLREILKT